jgi:protease-4
MRRLGFLLLFLAIVFMIVYVVIPGGPRIPERGVLVVELGGEIEEEPPADPIAQLTAVGWALPTVILQLEKAAADERVVGILLHIRPLSIGFARIQELRDSIVRAREADVHVAALLDMATLNSTRELYLASAASEVYVVPGFMGPFAGIAGEYLFMGELMDKVGIEFEYERVGEYKSAPETFSEREMSAPARRMMSDLLDTLFAQIVRGIAFERELEVDSVRALVDEAPATGQAYVNAGLADGIASRLEVVEMLGGDDVEEIDLSAYVDVDPRKLGLRTGPSIALVFGDGLIVQSAPRRAFGPELISADRMGKALQEAGEDAEIRAVVLRVNSGGGSALASDDIWQQVARVREQKPVVVSLSDVAASGGYYVASAAGAVVAEPATITGSIGVYMRRANLAGLYAKLGINAEVMTRGAQSSILSSSEPLTPAQRKLTRSLVEAAYAQFLDRIAEGRGMAREEIDKVGQGRVWLGETAHALGLVDEIGGLRAAVERAKREAGIADDEDPRRVIYPGPRSLFEQVGELLRGNAGPNPFATLDLLAIPKPLLGFLALLPDEITYLPGAWITIQ